MKKKYVEEVAPALMTKFQYESVMQIPKIEKIVVSVGCGDCKDNAKALDAVIKDITAITGQKAVATVAKKSVANFKLVGELLTLIAFVLQAVDELRHKTAKSLDFLLDGRHALLGRGWGRFGLDFSSGCA